MTDDEVLEQRKQAAKSARLLMEASRRVPDVREALMAICGRYGYSNIVDLADAEPQAVIELHEAVELMEEDTYDAVERRTRQGSTGG